MNTFALSSALTATTMLLCRVKSVEVEQVNSVLEQLKRIETELDIMIRDQLSGSLITSDEEQKPEGWDDLIARLGDTATRIPGSHWPVIEMRQSEVNAGTVVVDEILPALRALFAREPETLVKLREAVNEVDMDLGKLLDDEFAQDEEEGLRALEIVDVDGLLDEVEQMGLLAERPELHRELVLSYGQFSDISELARRMKASMFFGAAA